MSKHLAGETMQLPETVWRRTAPDLIHCPPLQGHVRTDVVIIGGGFTGQMAAITLREQGVSVVVLDATEPGWGASGRNNGQVIPGFKWDPEQLIAEYGKSEEFVAWGGDAPDLVFETIERYAIACNPVRNGWIQPAYTDVGAASIERRVKQWKSRGAPVEMLDSATLPQVLGTPIFQAGWLDRRGGSVNPLAYARGLAKVAAQLGASVHSRTAATALRKDGSRWIVECSTGAKVDASKVIVATAAYADGLVPGLSTAMVPVRTAQVATAPLSDSMLKAILPGRQCASDTRRLLTSFRLSPDNRLVMGGSGATATLDHSSIVTRLHAAAKEMWEHLGPLQWEYAWSGFFAVTNDHLPHIHETADGVICALGCNGRGIGISTAIGKLLAERTAGADLTSMPLAPSRMKPFAFHAFRVPGVAVATRYHGLRDRLDKAKSS
ncbi:MULTISPECIES: FAD-binding oxidoreductase [unclassified Acidovorax]|uniref:NAD(P)/FAD-dependent oxidoreductase n=1 Tax=unclassified Acidovorax TaxID=2684926 RepID=UPI001C4665DC|nr:MULTISPECIES: FAD-dependent oxidoreductase [unclassified Acidovorax]MBV7427365.1 FAD-binding oxidoreductase [Acidovorax sp. sif0732]MBV7448489.1 FAD-binding oxidoreductase [Acidovorax sp. sif0715]